MVLKPIIFVIELRGTAVHLVYKGLCVCVIVVLIVAWLIWPLNIFSPIIQKDLGPRLWEIEDTLYSNQLRKKVIEMW